MEDPEEIGYRCEFLRVRMRFTRRTGSGGGRCTKRQGGVEKKNTTHRKRERGKSTKMSYREEDAGRVGSDG